MNLIVSGSVSLLIAIIIIIISPTVITVELSDEEKAVLEKFKPIANEIVYKDYMRTDRYLARFLKARNWNIDQATEMLKKSMKWRKDNSIDTILQEDFSIFDENFRFILPGKDKAGRAVFISLIGMYDVRKFILAGKLPQTLRFLDRMVELAEVDLRRRIAEPGGEHINGTVFILDLSGFNLRKQGCALCLTAPAHLFTTLEQNNPGFVQRLILLNTPSIFLPIFDTLRPLLSQTTKEVLSIYGHNKDEWVPELLKYINPDQLPTQYGGTKVLDTLQSDWRKENPEISQFIPKFD